MQRDPKKTPMIPSTALLAAALVATWAAPAAAGDPKFEFAKDKPEESRKVEWKASAQAGLVLSRGNSDTSTLAGGAKASRKAGNNQFIFEAGGAYARSTILLFNDANMDGDVDAGELATAEAPGARAWATKARYDRFLTKSDSLYLTAVAGGDENAGKRLVVGGQVGYGRLLYKSRAHQVVGEIGYDFSYEDLAGDDRGGADIHSLRLLAGYEGQVIKDTGILAAVEVLANGNTVTTAAGEARPLDDTRVNGLFAVTTKVFENISFRVGLTAKFDNAPAPLPFKFVDIPPILADKLDTRTEATLIVNFL